MAEHEPSKPEVVGSSPTYCSTNIRENELSKKKESPRKLTQQQQEEILELLKEAYEFIDREFCNARDEQADRWIARTYKIIGKP